MLFERLKIRSICWRRQCNHMAELGYVMLGEAPRWSAQCGFVCQRKRSRGPGAAGGEHAAPMAATGCANRRSSDCCFGVAAHARQIARAEIRVEVLAQGRLLLVLLPLLAAAPPILRRLPIGGAGLLAPRPQPRGIDANGRPMSGLGLKNLAADITAVSSRRITSGLRRRPWSITFGNRVAPARS